MAKFYSARSKTISPLPWLTFALPFSLRVNRSGKALTYALATHDTDGLTADQVKSALDEAQPLKKKTAPLDRPR